MVNNMISYDATYSQEFMTSDDNLWEDRYGDNNDSDIDDLQE